MKKILVTGGLGFIGSHLCDYLVEKGYDLSCIDNLISGTIENGNKEVSYNLIDIQDYDDVFDIVSQVKPDVIFHLAAVSRTPWAVNDPLYTYRNNVVGSANVLEAARQSGVKKVVLASSNIVYAAQTPYKSSKLAMEMVARDYNDLYGLPTLCLRFSNVYGSLRQHEDNVLAALSKSKREKGKIFITGDGEQSRNFTHVFDICDILERAAFPREHSVIDTDICEMCGDLQHIVTNSSIKRINDSYNPTGRCVVCLKGQNTRNLLSEEVSHIQNKSIDIRGTEIDAVNPTTWTLNDVAKMFNCPIEYIPDRKGDIKKLEMQGPEKAKELLNFEAKRELPDYIGVYTNV